MGKGNEECDGKLLEAAVLCHEHQPVLRLTFRSFSLQRCHRLSCLYSENCICFKSGERNGTLQSGTETPPLKTALEFKDAFLFFFSFPFSVKTTSALAVSDWVWLHEPPCSYPLDWVKRRCSLLCNGWLFFICVAAWFFFFFFFEGGLPKEAGPIL